MKTTILLDYSFSADAKFSEKSKFLACSYQGVRNVSFSENFAYVLNEWPLCKASNNIMKTTCITTENAAKAWKRPQKINGPIACYEDLF